MGNYKTDHGFEIKHRSSAPSNPIKGEVWYNTTTQTLKGYQSKGAAWASGGDLNVGLNAIKGAGTQTAALAAGGDGSPGPLGTTQIYDGSSWTTSPDSIAPTRNSGAMSTAGTTTASYYAGGNNPGGGQNTTEEFDGSTWSAGGNYPASIGGQGGAGTLTAGLAFGGSPSHVTASNSYNGTSWTSTNALNTGRNFGAGCGTQTAALSAGGETPSLTNASESFNGTSWTATNNLTQPNAAAAMFGTTSSAQLCGGTIAPSPKTTQVQDWDGTSWSVNPASLVNARNTNGAAGATGALGFATGGNPFMVETEEYTDPSFATQTITTS